MHVYHYAAYEDSAQAAREYGTREEELDELLRGEVFVDLYKVVRRGSASPSRYGLKQVETFYFEREADLRAGDDSILALRELARASTTRRPSTRSRTTTRRTASRRSGSATGCSSCARSCATGGRRTARPDPEPPRPRSARRRSRRRPRFASGCAPTGERDEDLLAQLLLYHRREAKPVWWAFFDRIGRTSEELQDGLRRDRRARAGRRATGTATSSRWCRSASPCSSTSSAPATASRPGDAAAAARSSTLDDETGTLGLTRGPTLEDERRRRRALIPGGPYDTASSRRRCGGSPARASPATAATRRPVAARPRCRGRAHAVRARRCSQDDSRRAGGRLARGSTAAPRHPGAPGTGKTYTGARLIVRLMRLGRRVGVTAQSHKAIHNLLDEVERAARDRGLRVPRAQEGRALRGRRLTVRRRRTIEDVAPQPRRRTTTCCCSPAPPGCSRARTWTAWSTRFRRRGRPGLARRRARGRDCGAQRRPARRPAAARPGLAGDPSRAARRPRCSRHLLGDDDTVPAEPRALPLAHLADAPRRLPLHLARPPTRGGSTVPECARQRIDSPGLSGTGLRWLRSSTRATAARHPRRPSAIAPSGRRC